MNSSYVRHSWLSAIVLVLILSASASAQDPTSTSNSNGQSTATSTTGQSSSTSAAGTQTATNGEANGQPATTQTTTQDSTREVYWAPVGGLELDTHGTSYMFLGPHYHHPLRDNLMLVASVHANYLRYEFEENGGETRVGGPGLSTNVGLRFGRENWFQVGAGVGIKRRTERFFTPDNQLMFSDSEVRAGLNLSSSMWVNPTDRTNLHGQVNYGAEDGYLWSRLGAKRQVSNFNWTGPIANFLGGEVMAQGNDDIRSLQLGGFLELVHVKSSISVMLRGGWKQSTFDIGEDKTGPYFAVGYYQRLR